MPDVKAPAMPPVLETARTRMRGHVADDFTATAAMWADMRVVRYISGMPSTPEESWARLLRYIGHWQVLGFGYWVVEDKITSAFLGEVGFSDYKRDITPPLTDTPEIGWVLAPDAHGRGIATETVAAAVAWGDANLASAQTVCIFDPEHVVSQKVARKNGYVSRSMARYHGNETLVMARKRSA